MNKFQEVINIATHGRSVKDSKSKLISEEYSEILKRIGYLTDKISDGRLNEDTKDEYRQELKELLRREKYARY